MLVKIGVSGGVEWDKSASEPPFLKGYEGTRLGFLGSVFERTFMTDRIGFLNCVCVRVGREDIPDPNHNPSPQD